jgi:putative phage-type endonuclease
MVQCLPRPQYHFDIEQGTDEWHALRRGVITASAIGKLLTATGKPANNDTSRAQLYQLLAERITGESDAGFYNDDMARGHLLEPYARDLYAKHYAPVVECGFVTLTTAAGVLGYSPDGLVGDDGLIEIKCPKMATHYRYLMSDKAPAEHRAQMLHNVWTTGAAWCDFVSFDPRFPDGLRLVIRRVTFTPEEIAAYADAVSVFLAEVDRDESSARSLMKAVA